MLIDQKTDLRAVRATKLITRVSPTILSSLKCAATGNPLAAETNHVRLVDRLMAKNEMTRDEARTTAIGILTTKDISPTRRGEILRTGGPEAIWGTIDFVGVAFLERGRRAARAVARVAFKSGQALGSGFMVAPGLFLTNRHVIQNPSTVPQLCVEFDYELDVKDNPRGTTTFALDPKVFIADPVEGLDFTLIAVGTRLSGSEELSSYGYCPLSDASDKHALGEFVNIVEHPQGRYKEVVVRENRLVARSANSLLYAADTEPGSSGSPVFNNQWQAVALHHWGGPFKFLKDSDLKPAPQSVNEGIRISAIVASLRERVLRVDAAMRPVLEGALNIWDTTPPSETSNAATLSASVADGGQTGRAGSARINTDGSASWIFPIEIAVRAPIFDAPAQTASFRSMVSATAPVVSVAGPYGEANSPNFDFSDRQGYEPGFIRGFVVPLPKLNRRQKGDAVANREARPGADPFELPYHHFSVVVNGARKLAFFTACNIDGATAKFINRKDGTVQPLDPGDPTHGLQENLSSSEGAEATEKWFDDSRVADDLLTHQDLYDQQVVPGFPTSTGMARTRRMFQRGHLVRRLDPCWGTDNQALTAEADTFFFTNCTPQVGFFNMGQGDRNIPGTGGGKLWRAVENIVLRNARNERMRVCSFTGPVFGTRDRNFRGLQVPGQFFKIAVWAEGDRLRALGMIADQRAVISVWPEALFSGADDALSGDEAFQDPDELARVDDFLTTIARIETLTGLDFGADVRNADIRAGEGDEERPEHLEDIALETGRPLIKSAKPGSNVTGRRASKHSRSKL